MTATDADADDGSLAGRTVTESSRVVSLARSFGRWIRDSVLYQLSIGATSKDGNEESKFGRNFAGHSRVVSLARSFSDWVRGSFLYRWLTKEPDPEVIVIDLRETYTVGPIIWVLNRVIERLAPWWRASGLRRFLVWTIERTYHRSVRVLGVLAMAAGAVAFVLLTASGDLSVRSLGVALVLLVGGTLATRSHHSWEAIQSTRGYQLLRAALEPPEPPDEAESAESPIEESIADATTEVDDSDSETEQSYS